MNGDIGQIEQLIIISRDAAPPPSAYLKGSGGAFKDMSIHDFDTARSLMGDIVEVSAAGQDMDPTVDDEWDGAVITLFGASGAVGTIRELSALGYRLWPANRSVRSRRLRATRERDRNHSSGFQIYREEIDAFLAVTDIGLTFDTGHLDLGGGDPLRHWQRWGSRINHLHVKDVDLSVLQAVRARGGDMLDVWASGVFVPIGDGDLALADFVREVTTDGFEGWLVVEQDVLASAGTRVEKLENDQILNRERLIALMVR